MEGSGVHSPESFSFGVEEDAEGRGIEPCAVRRPRIISPREINQSRHPSALDQT